METNKPFGNLPKTVMAGRAFDMAVQFPNRSQQIVRPPGLFAYMFTNIGDTICRVNGMVIFPSATPATSLGDSRSISGHMLDLYKGNLNVSFATPAGANPLIEMVLLYYTESEPALTGRQIG